MRTNWIASTVIATTFLLAPLGVGFAKDKSGTPPIKGKITAVDTTANTITINAGKKAATPGPQTFSVTDKTVIKIDGTAAKLADVKPKMGAMVSLAEDGKTVKHLMIKSPKSAGTKEGASDSKGAGQAKGSEG